ncbi:contractile injection system tape measure protein [Xanthomarina gelatinilytica]|uniref:contractile injection system tape measure protein n=1 Tax=Xanthomarina gelatinilytica TaxID=1137281 RepID=UPI003AA832E2
MEDASRHHIIGSQNYSISIGDEKDAHSIQSSVSILQDRAIRSAIERVLDKYDDPNVVNQFAQVELDLGSIPKSNFEDELIKRIEEQLLLFFANRTDDRGRLRGGTRKTLQHSLLNKLEYFLENGHHRWDGVKNLSPRQILQQLTARKPKALSELLKQIGKKEQVRKRLVYQFHDEALEALVYLVKPQEADVIVGAARNVIKAPADRTLPWLVRGNLRNAVWEVIMAYLFVSGKSFTDKRSFLKYLIANVAIRFKITYDSLLGALTKSLEDDKSAMTTEFKSILQALEDDHKKSESISVDQPDEATNIDKQQFLQALEVFMYTGVLKFPAIYSFSQEGIRDELKRLLRAGDSYVLNRMEGWIFEPSIKARFQELVDFRMVTLFFEKRKNSSFSWALEFLEHIVDLKNRQTHSVADLVEKNKVEILLSVVRKGSVSKGEVYHDVLIYLQRELVGSKALFKDWMDAFEDYSNQKNWSEILSSVKRLRTHLEKNQVATFYWERKFAASIAQEILTASESGRIESRELLFIQSLQRLEAKTDFSRVELLQVLIENRDLKKSKFFRDLLSALETERKQEAHFRSIIEKELVPYLNKNEKELWGFWVAQYLPEWITRSGLTKVDFIRRLKRRAIVSTKYPELMQVLENIAGASSEEISIDDIVWEDQKMSTYVLKSILADFSKIKKASRSETVKAQALYLFDISEALRISFEEVLSILVKFTFSQSEYFETFKVLALMRDSQEFETFQRLILKRKTIAYKQELVLQILRTGEAPWWVKSYSIQEFNVDFRKLIDAKETRDKILRTLSNNDKTKVGIKYLDSNSIVWLIHESLSANKVENGSLAAEASKLADDLRNLGFLQSASVQQLKNELKKGVGKSGKKWFAKVLRTWLHNLSSAASIKFLELFAEKINGSAVAKLDDEIKDLFQHYNIEQTDVDLDVRLEGKGQNESLALEALQLADDLQNLGFLPRVSFQQLKGELAKGVWKSGKAWFMETLKTWLQTLPTEVKGQFLSFFKKRITALAVINWNDEIKALFQANEEEEIVGDHDSAENAKLQNIIYREPFDITEMEVALGGGLGISQQILLKETFEVLKSVSSFLTQQEKKFLEYGWLNFLIVARESGKLKVWETDKWSAVFYEYLLQKLGKGKAINVLYLSKEKTGIRKGSTNTVWSDMDKYLETETLTHQLTKESKIPIESTGKEELEQDYKKLGEEKPKIMEEAIYMRNAGLVILTPYLKTLFERCQLTEGGRFINEESIFRAAHILQYAAIGEIDHGEEDMIMAKVLCGLDLQTPIDRMLTLKEDEKEIVNGMLAAVTQQWKALNNTSVEGLQYSFIQREARLMEEEEQYYMRVEQKSFDMLLDQLPWSIGRVKMSWMQKTLVTEWR